VDRPGADDRSMSAHGSGSVLSRAHWFRRPAAKRAASVAFVLSGGGPLGALQAGGLKALLEKGIAPDVVAGASVGALNGAFVALDPTVRGAERLEHAWKMLKTQDFFPSGRLKVPWARFVARSDRVFENSGVRKFIADSFREATFEDTRVPFAVVATELNSGRERVFQTGPLSSPLLASTAMPGTFSPVWIEGRQFIDGGVSNNVPIGPAVAMGPKNVYILDAGHNQSPRPLNRPIDYLMHACGLSRRTRTRLDMALYAGRVRLTVVSLPHLDFFVPFATLDHSTALFDAAYVHVRDWLVAIEASGTEG
jgi:NTE family protein